VHNVSDVRQIEIHTAEIAIAKLNKYKSPGHDQILAELIQAGGETLPTICTLTCEGYSFTLLVGITEKFPD
jgi:hypothetical protein